MPTSIQASRSVPNPNLAESLTGKKCSKVRAVLVSFSAVFLDLTQRSAQRRLRDIQKNCWEGD